LDTAAGSSEQTKQIDFEAVKALVFGHFQVEEALIVNNVPTFYLKQPQETKHAFLRLLKELDGMNLIAFLRRADGRLVLKVLPKHVSKSGGAIVNLLLFIATVGTTFATGYMLSTSLAEIGGTINPTLTGAAFTVAIMAVLGLHEMGHRLAAEKWGVDATLPYFIPGPPPSFGGIGTFGAVIMQKSVPPNKDALFDIGASGPIVGFIAATLVAAVGLAMSVPAKPVEGAAQLPAPLAMILISWLLQFSKFIPSPSEGQILYMHPVGFAGWVGMAVTMLNLMPAAQLDGGHVAKTLFGEKTRMALTALSIILLAISGFWMMAIFVLLLAFHKHPGPLDDVSELSKGRKVLAVILMAIFIMAFPLF